MLDKQKRFVFRVGLALTMLIVATPVFLQILLEQWMGPGSSVSGGKLNGILMPINFCLAFAAFHNLLRSLQLTSTQGNGQEP